MKYLFSILIILLMFSCGSQKKHVSSNSIKTSGKCIEGNCTDGVGKYEISNGDLYQGYFRNGLYNGYGIYSFKNGDISYGGYRKGKIHGAHNYKWAKTGNITSGNYTDGVKHGEFISYNNQNEKIDSEYFNYGKKSKKPDSLKLISKKEFSGKYVTASVKMLDTWIGKRYYIELEFDPAYYSGRITLFPPGHEKAFYAIDNNNNRYELDFQSGFNGDAEDGFGSRELNEKFSVDLFFNGLNVDYIESLSIFEGNCEGKGCLNFNNITLPKIEGCLQGDCRQWFGILEKERLSFGWLYGSYGDSDTPITTYQGFFKNGEYHGEGMLTDSEGNKYVGSFKEGGFEGEGTMFFEDGDKYVGDFIDDEFEGEGTYFYNGGNKYVGEFKEGEFEGEGTFFFNSGNKYVGEFIEGDFEGEGTFFYDNGNKFIGNYSEGERHGFGTFYNANGEKYRDAMYEYGENSETEYRINFRNKCRKTIQVLIRFLNSNDNWQTKGWFNAEPGETIYIEDTENGIVYYYAESKKFTWSGSNFRSFRGDRFGFKKWDIQGEKGGVVKELTCN